MIGAAASQEDSQPLGGTQVTAMTDTCGDSPAPSERSSDLAVTAPELNAGAGVGRKGEGCRQVLPFACFFSTTSAAIDPDERRKSPTEVPPIHLNQLRPIGRSRLNRTAVVLVISIGGKVFS